MIRFDDAYGYLTFEFDAPPGADTPTPPPVRLDLYEANKLYVDTIREHEADAHAGGLAWRERLYALGFPPMSLANAYQVIRAVQAEIDRLGKAGPGSGTPG